jgi:hypothetical protein
VTVPTSSPSTSWSLLLGAGSPPSSGAGGSLAIAVPPLSAVLLRADADLSQVVTTPPGLRVVADPFSDYWLPSATPRGGAPVSVAFAVKRARGSWQRLAVDDSPPYRAVLDPARFRRNEQIYLVAIVRGLGGEVAVSRVVSFAVRRR